MANLLTSRVGQGYTRRSFRRRPSQSQAVAALPGLAQAGLGRDISGLGDDYYQRQAAKVTAEESTQYEVAKMNLFNGWETEKRESGILDTDGTQFAAYAKEHEDDLFGHFSFKPAREMAQNNWLKSSTAAALEYAANDRLREEDQFQSANLLQMNEATQFPDAPPSQTQATENIAGILALSERGQAAGYKAFQDESVNFVRNEELIKSVAGQYLLANPDFLDSANEVLDDLYDGDLPEGFKFTTQEVAGLKDQYQKSIDAAKGIAGKERAERATTFDSEMTEKQLRGESTAQDRNAIIDNPDLSPARKTTLVNQHDRLVKSYAQGEEYDPVKKIEALREIYTAKGADAQYDKIIEHTAGLGFSVTQPILKKLLDPTTDESPLIQSIDDSFKTMRSNEIKTLEASLVEAGEDEGITEAQEKQFRADVAQVDLDLMRQEVAIYQHFQENPKLTPDQQDTYIQGKLNPILEKQGEDIVKQGLFERLFGGPRADPAFMGPFGGIPASRKTGHQRPSEVAENQWQAFDVDIQNQIIQAFALGLTWEQISQADDIKPLLLGAE